MQLKGLVKLFLVLLVFVVALQYLYLYPTWKVEKAADKYAQSFVDKAPKGSDIYQVRKDARIKYLDSMSSEVIFKIPLLADYTYNDLKKSQLALGLDLKGGMSVILQVNLKDFVSSLSNENKDAKFRKALDNAEKALASSQDDYITLFQNEWEKIAEGDKLAKVFINNPALRNTLNFNTSDDEVINYIREKSNETVKLTFNMLKQRIDKLGVVQPNISLDEKRNLILVELPGIDNPERARKFLQASAKLEFWNVYRMSDPGIYDAFMLADRKLKAEMDLTQTEVKKDSVQYDTVFTPVMDSLGNKVDSTMKLVEKKNVQGDFGPLLSKLQISVNAAQGGDTPICGFADVNKRSAITEMLERPDIKSLFPKDLFFRWSMKPTKDRESDKFTSIYELYILKKESGTDKAPLEGDRVVNSNASIDQRSGAEVEVTLAMDQKGAKKWGEMTTIAANDKNRPIAIVLDEEVVSAPSVRVPILDGNSSITGGYTMQEAQDFSRILEIGKLPAKPQIIQESTVGPSLGADNIAKSINSLLIGFALVLIFMVFYYGSSGIIAILALLLNVFFIFGVLASIGTVLTLPGFAGIALTMGMAIDANVIINERVREELRAGRSLWDSIENGYKHSYSAIIDGQVTTLLIGIVLAYFGLGPIKGFAVVLIVGILLSLFTSVLISKMLFDWWVKTKNKTVSFWIPLTKNSLAHLNVDWIGKRKIAYVISGTLILVSLISMLTRGFELGVDFKGGYSYNIEFTGQKNVDVKEVRKVLGEAFGGSPVVKAVDVENTLNVVTSYNIGDNSENAADKVSGKLFEGLSKIYPDMNKEKFLKEYTKDDIHITSSTKVGASIADDITKSAFLAGILALLAIFVYILIRFSKWQYSLGGVVSLFHDAFITLGMFSLLRGVLPFSLEIDQAVIASILTLIGYSINDTVIVYDRIRENLLLYRDKPVDEILNSAINSTFSRTTVTSLVTLFTIVVVLFFGGSSIKGFAFAMSFGIIIGTYSSIFVATPIARDFSPDLKPAVKKSSFSRAKK
jgi:SecD/SecF fusion protein